LVVVTTGASHSTTAQLGLVAITVALVGLVVGNLRRLLLAVVVFDIPFQWDMNFGYHMDAAKLGAFGGLNFSLTTIAIVGLYGLWFAERSSGATRAHRLRVRPGAPLIAYVAVAVVAVFVARNATLSVDQIVLFVQTLLLFVYLASAIRTRADLGFLTAALMASLAIESLLIIFSHVTGSAVNLPGTSQSHAVDVVSPGQGLRAGGTVGPPNTAGAYLSLLLAPALSVAVAPGTRRLRQLAACAFVLGTIALILTFSRGGWIAFAVSMTVVAYAGWRRRLFRARVPIALALVLVAVIVPFASGISARLNKSDGGAAHSRVPLLHIAENVIRDHPLLGVGPNNFAVVLPDYATLDAKNFVYVVHNKYLLIWAESGIAALLAYLWFLGATLRRGLRCARAGDDAVALLGVGLFAAVLGHMAHMFVDIFQSRPIIQLLWLVAALLVAMEALATAADQS
jgi:putative inorganic carbon (HCO3(-)) transporter